MINQAPVSICSHAQITEMRNICLFSGPVYQEVQASSETEAELPPNSRYTAGGILNETGSKSATKQEIALFIFLHFICLETFGPVLIMKHLGKAH